MAPIVQTPRGSYASSPTPYVVTPGGNITFSLPNTGSVAGVIVVTVPYSPAVGGGSAGTEYVPPNVLIELACDHTTRALRQTTTCHVTKNVASFHSFTSLDIVVSWVGVNGTVTLGTLIDKAPSAVDFDVTALVLSGVGQVQAVVLGDDRFKYWNLTIETSLAFTCPKGRMATGQSQTCTISANTPLLASDVKSGHSSKDALTFGTITASAAGVLSLPVTATKGASSHTIAVLLPNDEPVLPINLPIVEIVDISCRPSVKPTRIVLNTRASCILIKTASSADLLPADIAYSATPAKTIDPAVIGNNGNLNFTYVANALCGTAGCALDIKYSADLGGATVARASNTFFVIDVGSETHPSGRKARGFADNALFEKAASQPDLLPSDVAPVWSSNNFLVSSTPLVKSGGGLTVSLTPSTGVINGKYRVSCGRK
eukprot:tig00020710_g13366.t1